MHGPAGFASSNVSKGLLVVTLIWSITAIWTKKVGLFSLDLTQVGQGQIWRLITHNFVWSTTSELVLGSILLYNWRMFERQFGTRKFGATVAFMFICSTILQVVTLLVSRGALPNQGGRDWLFSTGPYGFAFGCLAMFLMDIPQSAPFTLFGIPLSDKLFVYLLAIQLALSTFAQGNYGSGYTALIGLALGFLYRLEFLPFHRLRVPQWVSHCFGTVFSPILSGSLFATIAGVQDNRGRRLGGSGRVGGRVPTAGGAALGGPGAVQLGGQAGPDGYAPVGAADEPEGEILNAPPPGLAAYFAQAAAPVVAQPDPNAVAQLTSMGFSEERARAALAATGNNVPAATNRLLGV